jgi:hypothetical protein
MVVPTHLFCGLSLNCIRGYSFDRRADAVIKAVLRPA